MRADRRLAASANPVDTSHLENLLFAPARLWAPAELDARPSPVPTGPGVYAWYFREPPALVPTGDCVRREGAHLLYVGIAPSRPGSGSSLSSRVRSHLRGNASGSTLRLSLGCLLASELGLRLRPVGRRHRLTFAEGEATLSAWLERNALIAWAEVGDPWEHEQALIRSASLPLNLDHNAAHPFHAALSELRAKAKGEARERAAKSR